MEEQIQKLMKTLGISRAEALEVIAADDEIDHGQKLFELSPDQKKVEKAMKNFDSKTKPSPGPTGKKLDPDRLFIYNLLRQTVGAEGTILDDSETHREFSFLYKDKKYKLTIACPRT